MPQEKYQPVILDYQASLDKAMQCEGFKEAWDALEDEYAALKVFMRHVNLRGLLKKK